MTNGSRIFSRIDRLLALGGIACACASVIFACAMNLRPNKAPLVFGEEYLGIFGKPNTQPRSDAIALNAPAHADAPQGFDLTPTGSIPRQSETGAEASATAGPEFVSVFEGGAWMKSGADFVLVRVGDLVPGYGRVSSIEKIDGSWMVVLADGATIGAAAAPNGDARFARSLIFQK